MARSARSRPQPGGDAGSGAEFGNAAPGGAATATSAATESGLGGAANSSATATGGFGGPGSTARPERAVTRREVRQRPPRTVGRRRPERRRAAVLAAGPGRVRPATAARPTLRPPRPLRPAARPTRRRAAADAQGTMTNIRPRQRGRGQRPPLFRRFSARGILRRAPARRAATGGFRHLQRWRRRRRRVGLGHLLHQVWARHRRPRTRPAARAATVRVPLSLAATAGTAAMGQRQRDRDKRGGGAGDDADRHCDRAARGGGRCRTAAPGQLDGVGGKGNATASATTDHGAKAQSLATATGSSRAGAIDIARRICGQISLAQTVASSTTESKATTNADRSSGRRRPNARQPGSVGIRLRNRPAGRNPTRPR